MTQNYKNVSKENIISVQRLSKAFNLEAGFFARDVNKVYAVNNVTFNINKGETYGIVGESGSGKSVTAYSIMQILSDPGKIVSGRIKVRVENEMIPIVLFSCSSFTKRS